jgi:hypothetical protein
MRHKLCHPVILPELCSSTLRLPNPWMCRLHRRVFDMQQQLWNARKPDGTVVSTLLDGLKYLLGVKWLPTGWEIGWVPKHCTVPTDEIITPL